MSPAIPQEQRSLIDRMREAVPGLEWRMSGKIATGRDAGRDVVSANQRGHLLCWVNAKDEPHAVDIQYPGDTEAVRIVREWWVKTHVAPKMEALVEAIRAACPEVNAYSDDEAVRVFWGRMSWRFEPDGEHWKCGGTHCTERGAVHAIREHIDTHTLAEDQSLKGLTQQLRCTAWSGERAVTEEELATLKHEKEARAKPAEPTRRVLELPPDSLVITMNVSAPIDPKELAEALHRSIEYAQKRGHTPGSVITGAPSMDTKTLTQTIKVDASEAAWRTAGSQFVKLAREPLVGLLQRHLAPGDDAFRARLAAFLETELGTALLASMLSASLSAMPQATGDVPQKLARELRVRAMADAGDVLADVLMGPLRQVMALYLQDPQGAPQLGVAQATAVDFAGVGAKEGVR